MIKQLVVNKAIFWGKKKSKLSESSFLKVSDFFTPLW